MFTGIITDQGRIEKLSDLAQGKRIRMITSYDVATIELGASIAHDGVCLTVVEKADDGGNWYDVEAWEEALRLTTAGKWQEGDVLNLERALKVGDELGGHIVSGHVDAMAQIVKLQSEGDASRFTLEVPDELAKFIAPKGSVALNGTSLTVNGVSGNQFDVLLIRHSMEVTGWGRAKLADNINLEVDTMARYAARLAEFPTSSK